MNMPVDIKEGLLLPVISLAPIQSTGMNGHMCQQKAVLRKHSPDVNLLEVPLQDLILAIVMVPEDQPLVAIELAQKIRDIFPRSADVDVSEVVDLVLRLYHRVPSFDHLPVHMFSGFKRSVAVLDNIAVIEMGIGDDPDIPTQRNLQRKRENPRALP